MCFGEVSGVLSRLADRFAHHCQPARAAAGRESVLVGGLGVRFEELTGGNEMPGNPQSQLLGKGLQC
jgi:hypothetical protein